MSHCSEMSERDKKSLKKRKAKKIMRKVKTHNKQKCILPDCDHKMGYTSLYLDLILICLGVDKRIFWDKFGVNTCALDERTGCPVYYKCDVESALYLMGYGNKHHGWD